MAHENENKNKKNSIMSSLNFFATDSEVDSGEARQSVTKIQKHHGLTWIDIENPVKESISKFAEDYSFHPLHIEDSLLENTLPQLEKEENYLFLLLHVPILDSGSGKIVESPIAIFLGKDYLLTTHSNAAINLTNLFTSCEHSEERQAEYFKRSAGFLLYSVLQMLLDDASDLVKQTLGELDQAEDQVFDSKKSDTAAIAKLRQKILRLRRTIHSISDVTIDLAPHVHHLTSESLVRHLRDINRQADWLLGVVKEAEKTVEIYKDADFTASTERTNEILAILTIIFTLAIPATVYGTFYGMNIPMPGADTARQWTFWGTFTTFYVIVGVSIISAVAMYVWFKKKKWF